LRDALFESDGGDGVQIYGEAFAWFLMMYTADGRCCSMGVLKD